MSGWMDGWSRNVFQGGREMPLGEGTGIALRDVVDLKSLSGKLCNLVALLMSSWALVAIVRNVLSVFTLR